MHRGRPSLGRRVTGALVAAATGTLLGVPPATAVESPPAALHACIRVDPSGEISGRIRIVPPETPCRPHEARVQWTLGGQSAVQLIQGPPGPRGPRGPAGPQGPPGPPGPASTGSATEAQIHGVVSDCGGAPLAGLTVFIPGRSTYAITDGNGAFLLANLPPGSYSVSVRLSEASTPLPYVDVPTMAADAAPLSWTYCPE